MGLSWGFSLLPTMPNLTVSIKSSYYLTFFKQELNCDEGEPAV